jgi:hypothetical protein
MSAYELELLETEHTHDRLISEAETKQRYAVGSNVPGSWLYEFMNKPVTGEIDLG